MRLLLKAIAGLVAFILLVFVIFVIWASQPVPTFEPLSHEPVPPQEWPTQGWPRATAEAQGMSSEKLLAMAQYAAELAASDPEFFLDSFTVIRNGHIVAEIYANPNYPQDSLHVLHSATKSIVSALIGIAIERGLIESVDVRLVDIFAGRDIANLDPDKEALTVRNLLSMQTGLHSRDSHLYGYEGLFALQQSEDWLQFALDLPMSAAPGTRFDYSNISTFLLGAILAEVTAGDVLSFARETLFDPLGIKDVRWEKTRDGLPIAWARMWMKPNDLAKIGLLYLQKGRWDGQQVIPRAWVETSVSPYAYPKNSVDILNPDMTRDHLASGGNLIAQRFLRPFADGYGYQWWLDGAGNYLALGTNGQYLIVSPATNVIVVATAKSKGLAQFTPAKLFYDFVLPAVQADTPLPHNPEAQAALAAFASPPERASTPVLPVTTPEIALSATGKTFATEPNPNKTDNLHFEFDRTAGEVKVSFSAREGIEYRFETSLDGRARLTENETGTYVAKGRWSLPDTLVIEVEMVGYSTRDLWEFRFEKDLIRVTEHSITGTHSYSARSRN